MRTWSTAKLLDSKSGPTDPPLCQLTGGVRTNVSMNDERERREDGLYRVQNGDDRPLNPFAAATGEPYRM